MKAILETIGDIMLVDPQTREVLPEDRPAVMTWTQFLEARTGAGQIRVLHSGLPAEASDEEFKQFLKDAEDTELAIASFCSCFEDKVEEAPKPKGKAKAKAQPQE